MKRTLKRGKITTFGENLGHYLHSIKMTQLDLSCRTSLTRACVSQIITGKRNPSLETALKILQALNVNLETIMTFNRANRAQ